MKSLMLFLQTVLSELGTGCRTSTSRDFKTITARVEHEGFSFLTITLPQFGKDFEKSLDQGCVTDDLFAGFTRSGGLPRFLVGFLQLVFDRRSGRLLDEPSVTAIWAVRQITLMWAKMLLDCREDRRAAAIDRYVQVEQEVRDHDRSRKETPHLEDSFHRVSRLLWANILSSVDQQVYTGNLIPQHGPGATADRLRGNMKWKQREWTQRLEEVLPHMEYLIPNLRHYQSLADVTILEPGAERPVRVVEVPKTLKTPRIIAIEPTAMQYAQQGIRFALEDAITSDQFGRAFVRYKSQEPNRAMACTGSREGTLATLDLSDASDRVSNQLVRLMLSNHPHLAGAVDACRSRKADVTWPDGKTKVIRLAKFASMGSALTFPIEAMVFTTICFIGIERVLSRPITHKDVESFVGAVRVYGDDIIVPVEYVHAVIQALEDFGLRVNKDKSFWNGKFRESCGKEYYDGEDVSIVRVRRVFPSRRQHSAEIVSAVSLSNQLFMAGLWKSAAHVDQLLEGILPLPVVASTSPGLGRHSFLGVDYNRGRYDYKLHRRMVYGGVLVSRLPDSHLDDVNALMKVLSMRASRDDSAPTDPFFDLPVEDEQHLLRAGRPQQSDIKLRWFPSW